MFSIFLLKTEAGLWHHCPGLSIHHSLWLDSTDIKVCSKDAVKKVLDLAEE